MKSKSIKIVHAGSLIISRIRWFVAPSPLLLHSKIQGELSWVNKETLEKTNKADVLAKTLPLTYMVVLGCQLAILGPGRRQVTSLGHTGVLAILTYWRSSDGFSSNHLIYFYRNKNKVLIIFTGFFWQKLVWLYSARAMRVWYSIRNLIDLQVFFCRQFHQLPISKRFVIELSSQRIKPCTNSLGYVQQLHLSAMGNPKKNSGKRKGSIRTKIQIEFIPVHGCSIRVK